jgi:hypothetical protein
MGVRFALDDQDTLTTLEAWLADNGPQWAAKVRAVYGEGAEDVLAMVLGGVA